MQVSQECDGEFDVLYNQHFPIVRDFIGSRFGDYHFGENVAQETLLKLWMRGVKEGDNIGAFLLTVAFRTALDLIDKDKRRARGLLSLDEVDLPVVEPAFVCDVENSLTINSIMGELDPDKAEIIYLSEYLELSYSEMAAELRIPEGTVKSRLSRALKQANDRV